MTVSFFVHLDDARFPKSPSTVKFGSWDASSITGKLTMIRTKTKTSWDIRCNLFKFDKDDDGLKLSSLLRIDPGLPSEFTIGTSQMIFEPTISQEIKFALYDNQTQTNLFSKNGQPTSIDIYMVDSDNTPVINYGGNVDAQ